MSVVAIILHYYWSQFAMLQLVSTVGEANLQGTAVRIMGGGIGGDGGARQMECIMLSQ